MTSEQLEAARAERLRQNGLGTLTFEDARTWIEETGLCLFLPRKQFASAITPSFVEAISGHHEETPNQKQIAAAEELLVRLELDGVAVRLNLLGQPGEQPDFVVASWVLPYVYALRGDRDWRRSPQLTGSRQVSPLAIQVYKLLEAGDSTVSQLKHALGREVTESAVVRAITELWQQLRIIPVISAPGKAAKWQLLRHRFQKAIAEGASTSQVTAISVLASIYLQAVIAASMEEVEVFLSPLTARSKVREVIRGLVATRQVHTISLGHAPHFYVAGTLPEFAPASSIYSSAAMSSASFFLSEEEESHSLHSPARSLTPPHPGRFEPRRPIESHAQPVEHRAPAPPANGNGHAAAPQKPALGNGNGAHAHSNGHSAHVNDRRPGQTASRPAPRVTEGRPVAKRAPAARPTASSRWSAAKPKSSGARKSAHSGSSRSSSSHSSGAHRTGSSSSNGHRHGKPATKSASWGKTNGHKATAKTAAKKNGARVSAVGRKDSRVDARSARPARKPARSTASVSAGSAKRYGFKARPGHGNKKRG
ncbi:MAG TPA: hypothetical protein VG844_09745 [Terracidiphilus sp.]|nr:hypothetical protein [Terracidiphilus sp.]